MKKNSEGFELTDTGHRKGFHHRLYPYMDEFVQYATERNEDMPPWVVRDRSTALRNERLGEGRAMVRTWIPTDWVPINEIDD